MKRTFVATFVTVVRISCACCGGLSTTPVVLSSRFSCRRLERVGRHIGVACSLFSTLRRRLQTARRLAFIRIRSSIDDKWGQKKEARPINAYLYSMFVERFNL
ncbi:hypothetical protein BC834DRAFT_283285 [Gloeopeniophorella convolvens]|nr:hypothetical protein BC834DRAFT_283285 [Gloeopeniophorella convolvens]